MTGTTPIDVIIQGDCLEEMKKLPDRSIDAIVTDPPYELTSGNSKKGFMGKAWDGTGIAYNVDMWGECLRVLKPGGHLLAFGGTRTYHRMACAIEDAGFEIRDSIHWVYGSGFPKSLNISIALDKAAKAERKVISVAALSNAKGSITNYSKWERPEEYDITAPATEAAKQWAGWGSALKPAHEPVVLARKPLDAGCTIAENVLRWSTGALNIDQCRISTSDNLNGGAYANTGIERNDGWGMQRAGAGEYKQPVGRFPSNLIHDNSPAVLAEFAKANTHRPGNKRIEYKRAEDNGLVYGAFNRPTGNPDYYVDSGSAARFFMACEFTEEDYYVTTCALCNKLLYHKHYAKNEVLSCNVNGAEKSSSQEAEIVDSVATHAQQKQQHESGAKSDKLNIPASSAVKSLSNMLETSGSFAQRSVSQNHIEKIAQNVRSAGNLCDSCETAIVQSIVAMQQGQDLESILKLVSINEHKRQILYQSLALFAETQENIATIPTIPSLKMWFGYVNHAIENYTRQEKAARMENTSAALTPFVYHSKASMAEREAGLDGMPLCDKRILNNQNCKACTVCGKHWPNSTSICSCGGDLKTEEVPNPPQRNHHPTVKPLALMRYLCRLITPPGGIILDPFGGSGTTGLAAIKEGFHYILIEQQAEYCEIARKRIAAVPARLDRWAEAEG